MNGFRFGIGAGLCDAQVVLTSVAVSLQAVALFFLVWQPTIRFPIDASGAKADSGNAYTVMLPDPGQFGYRLIGDALDRPKQSGLRVREGDHSLGPAHSLHDTIRTSGGGAYSHWGQVLYFSASDNTDPRNNGRRYEAESRLTLQAAPWWSLLVSFAGATAGLLWIQRSGLIRIYLYARASPAESLSVALMVAGCAATIALALEDTPGEAEVGPLGPLLLHEALEARDWSRSVAPYYYLRAIFPEATFLLGSKDLVSEAHLSRLARAKEIELAPEPFAPDEALLNELDRAASIHLSYYARTTMPVELAGQSIGRDLPMVIIRGDRPGVSGQKIAIFLSSSKIYVVPMTSLHGR